MHTHVCMGDPGAQFSRLRSRSPIISTRPRTESNFHYFLLTLEVRLRDSAKLMLVLDNMVAILLFIFHTSRNTWCFLLGNSAANNTTKPSRARLHEQGGRNSCARLAMQHLAGGWWADRFCDRTFQMLNFALRAFLLLR